MAHATRPDNENNSGATIHEKISWIRVQIFLQKPQRFSQIRIPKIGICPSTRKEVAACSGREIHGHRRASILVKEKSLFVIWTTRPFLTCHTARLNLAPLVIILTSMYECSAGPAVSSWERVLSFVFICKAWPGLAFGPWFLLLTSA
jgi:hypothetical protein